ncbi:MAG: hypothetical protein EOP84_17490 [Verrucomicrobiaceae bacterium]|nr:MAG: hypothetical protein EOP84_17490 [Verrucomicrobiaceae bacterium]
MFDTSGIVQSGLGASNYVILSATFTLQISFGDAVFFDGTYDPINTYGASGEPINGDDQGRPMELYGAGFRNGFTSATITENLGFGVPGEGTRNIYATDFNLGSSINGPSRDVSNNIANAFDPIPFAIGQVAPSDLTDGFVDEDADVVFTLNLANPDVLRYLQLSLNDGRVSFLATSLHQASQGGEVTYPNFYTKENLLDGLPGRLDIQVQVVPEPSPGITALLGFGVMVAFWRGGRTFRRGEGELS